MISCKVVKQKKSSLTLDLVCPKTTPEMFDKSGMTPPQGHNVTLGSKEALNDSGRLN